MASLQKRLDILIRDARRQSGNVDYSATQGIKQAEFVRWANDAQDRLFNLMQSAHSTLFTKESFIDSVSGQASYALPSDVFISHNVSKVDYSLSGNAQGYAPLEYRTARQEISVPGYPTSYFLRNGYMIVSPIPMSSVGNGFRLNYEYTIPTLDMRRGLISTHGLTSITLTDNATLIEETEDDLTDGWVDYITVVNAAGTQVATAIPVTGYSSTTKIIACTLTAAQNTAVQNTSNYVIFGTGATTHANLPQVCERYLTAYMTTMAQLRDSNKEAGDSSTVLKSMEDEIMAAIEILEEDIMAIPIGDSTMLNYADDL